MGASQLVAGLAARRIPTASLSWLLTTIFLWPLRSTSESERERADLCRSSRQPNPSLPARPPAATATMSVGVLALQGSYNEHLAALKRIGVKGVEVRKPDHLGNVSALIIPGGESTTMAKLAEYHNLFPALRDFVKMGKPVWGTCAGLIFLANKAVGQKSGGQELLGGLDCTVHRNFFGSQLQSFEAELPVPAISTEEGGPETFRAVFIRAPAILEVGPDVEVLADYSVPESSVENSESAEKVIVAVKQGKLLATAFHPELTADTRWHSYFMKMVSETDMQSGGTSSEAASDDGQKPELPIFQ